MKLQKQIDQLIAHQASEWMEILKTGGPQEREAFVEWLCESRKHVAEFLTMSVIDDELNKSLFNDLARKDQWLKHPSPSVIAMKDQMDGSTLPSRQAPKPSIPWRWASVIAAGIGTVALILTLLLQTFSAEQEFMTTDAKQRAIELKDGSVMLLNTDSHVLVRMDKGSRELHLVSGEALFKVAKDPHRPFTVRIRDTRVQAVGTEFNINARKADTVVSVLEGTVLVSSNSNEHAALLEAGEAASVTQGGGVDRTALPDTADAARWRKNRLVFKRTPLEDVVAEFNRHNVTPKLRLERIDGRSRRYSMIFDAEDPHSFADFLQREEDVLIERRGNEIFIRSQ